ncbi:MAG: hypothetical protein R3332_03775 [Pseudohongiellaceae bacterium]|nr:hypothetical protein [Pseudohongiellaceae bacterium]
MKTMTCKELGGACDLEFKANTFEELAELSKEHGMEMFQKNDPDHLEAMAKMRELLSDPEGLQKWMNERRQAFEAKPQD